jgi:DNA-binding NarL/FixJ family response regulator
VNIIRILIADDQTLMRDGLKTILDLEDDMEVVDTAENGRQAYEMAQIHLPDVILMDIRMPEMDGVESTRIIKKDYPKIKVIMLTTFNDEEYIIQALSFGASGYLLKDIQGDKLIEAIRNCASGNMVMPAQVAEKLSQGLSNRAVENKRQEEMLIKSFSDREKEIALMIVAGLTNRQIASKLCITEGTAKNYICNIYSKIDISDRTKAAIYLKEHITGERDL